MMKPIGTYFSCIILRMETCLNIVIKQHIPSLELGTRRDARRIRIEHFIGIPCKVYGGSDSFFIATLDVPDQRMTCFFGQLWIYNTRTPALEEFTQCFTITDKPYTEVFILCRYIQCLQRTVIATVGTAEHHIINHNRRILVHNALIRNKCQVEQFAFVPHNGTITQRECHKTVCCII